MGVMDELINAFNSEQLDHRIKTGRYKAEIVMQIINRYYVKRTAAQELIDVAQRHVDSFDERNHEVLGLLELKLAADKLKGVLG